MKKPDMKGQFQNIHDNLGHIYFGIGDYLNGKCVLKSKEYISGHLFFEFLKLQKVTRKRFCVLKVMIPWWLLHSSIIWYACHLRVS